MLLTIMVYGILWPVEQMNITLSPQMARFIRDKVEKGEYTNISEVVRDAVRRMQEVDAARKDREWLADFEQSLPKAERAAIGRKVPAGPGQGICRVFREAPLKGWMTFRPPRSPGDFRLLDSRGR